MLSVFNIPFADEDFRLGGKLHQHYYVKLCSLLVGHMLTGAEKNDKRIKKLGGNNLRSIRIRLGKKRNVAPNYISICLLTLKRDPLLFLFDQPPNA
jgi:hypothetical protein